MIDSCFVEKTNEICDLEGFRREEHTFWISSVDIAFYWFFLFSFYILHKNMKERNKKQHSVSFSISLLIGPKSYVISKNNPIKCSPTFSFSFTQDVQLEIVWDWFHFLFSIILLQIVNRYPVSCSIHSQLNLSLFSCQGSASRSHFSTLSFSTLFWMSATNILQCSPSTPPNLKSPSKSSVCLQFKFVILIVCHSLEEASQATDEETVCRVQL